jgi:hypothetical protein
VADSCGYSNGPRKKEIKEKGKKERKEEKGKLS